MSRGTIIYVGEFFLPDRSAAANRVVANGKLFSALGYTTVFLGASEDSFEGIRKVGNCENMYEQSHPATTKQWIEHTLSTKEIISLTDKYKDVRMVVLYNLPVITLCAVKNALRGKNIEVIYDCTEWTQSTSGSFFKKAFKYVDELAVRRLAHRIADGMIVISSLMAENYRKAKKLLLLPPLVDTDDSIWHQSCEENDGVFEFCFAGVPDGNKEKPDVIVEAFKNIKRDDIRLRMIGITREEFARLYPDIGLTCEEEKKIIFMGALSHRQTIRYLLSSNCCVFLRVSDRRNNAGFPTKFTEAHTCGIPVITTDVSDIKGYMTDEDCGCVLSSVQIQDISAAMLKEAEKGCRSTELKTTFDYKEYKKSCEAWLNG